MEVKMETKEKRDILWLYRNFINTEGLILSGKHIINLIILVLVINFSLSWLLSEAGKVILMNHTFLVFFMLGIMIMPTYVCYKNIEEIEGE